MPKRTDKSMIGKMLSTGLDLLSVAEEGARKPGKLPRDVASHLARFLDHQKDEIMNIVREEIRYALDALPFEEIVRDVLIDHDVNITLHMTKRKPKKKSATTRKKRS